MIQKDEEIREVRRDVGQLWRDILSNLKREVAACEDKQEPIPEELVKACKVASDQLRVDFRTDQLEPATTATGDAAAADEAAAEAGDSDPLAKIRLHSEDAA